jgi:prepilin-type N-terminal cleavage/methylation domain-containing protein
MKKKHNTSPKDPSGDRGKRGLQALRTAGSEAGFPRPNRSAGTGFTLVELLLAVALSALLLTILYTTYFSINRSIVVATEGQDALDTGRALMELLKHDIRAMSTANYPFIAKNVEIDGRQFGDLEFVTNALSATDPLRLRRVEYSVVLVGNGEKVMVRKESTDLIDLIDKPPVDNPPKVLEISRIVTGFVTEFYNGTTWLPTWDSGAGGALPKQIRITIDVADTKGTSRRFVAEEAIQSAIQ